MTGLIAPTRKVGHPSGGVYTQKYVCAGRVSSPATGLARMRRKPPGVAGYSGRDNRDPSRRTVISTAVPGR